MVSREDFDNKKFSTHGVVCVNDKTFAKVSPEEMRFRSENTITLQKLLSRSVEMHRQNFNSMTATYNDIEEKCFITGSAIKKALCGVITITRNMLYKYTVGMGMSIDEANKFFVFCGGALKEDNDCDYIIMCALRDKDSIISVDEEFQKYANQKLIRMST